MRIRVVLLAVVLLLAAGGEVFATETDPAREDPSYKVVSSEPLGAQEKAVAYSYMEEGLPCGTLMTQYTAKGSAALGGGPVGKVADAACLKDGADFIPDVTTARAYACENFSKDGRIIGRATFAFSCTNDHEALERRKQEDTEAERFRQQTMRGPEPAIPEGAPPTYEPDVGAEAARELKEAASRAVKSAGDAVSQGKAAIENVVAEPSSATNAYFKAAEAGDIRAQCWVLEGYIKQKPCAFEEVINHTPEELRDIRHLTSAQIEAEKKLAERLKEIAPNCYLQCD